MLATLLAPAAHAATWSLFGQPPLEPPVATYRATSGDLPPQAYAELPAWLAARQRLPSINMLGGNYWLVAPLQTPDDDAEWVVTFDNTYYRRANLVILGDDGSRQRLEAGRGIDTNVMLRGTVPTTLRSGHRYAVVIQVTSPFFTALPRIDLQTREAYRRRLTNESALMLTSLGVLGGLGVFILFVGLWTRVLSYTLYGCQSLILMAGWASFFGLPADWFGMGDSVVNFTLWFILVPVVHAPFTVRFLELKRHAPRATRIGYGIAIVSALAVPVAMLLPSMAFLIATIAVTSVVFYSASVSIWALLSGIRQARFFVLAYVCVLVPGAIILPVNFGLMHSPVDNADLLTLMGNSGEAMLLAFALADHMKLVQAARERFRQGMQDAIARASTDPLTGLGNRLAFNMRIEEITRRSSTPSPLVGGAWQIAMIDLDGLKQINDNEGHERGDALLQAAARELARLPCQGHAYRLGGDEFAVIAFGDELSQHRLTYALSQLDHQLREYGFLASGLSFGICGSKPGEDLDSSDVAAMAREADRMMYEHKSRRRSPSAGGREAQAEIER
ncbi:sensor domain-containing diguanylate cyclase [Dyella telluris]|uniref:diguanylate cyclase n=1 Tax=Dyella telluris TaxID=2763498 RepID=A0A7G8Q048_9GAMM|nr:diguanylate cyclase [Dyella telluris]QNK00156.1 GGDEF domain-containing protein [Dyella telluris]